MSNERACPKCSGVARCDYSPAAVEFYVCSQCGHEFAVHIHYIVEPMPLGIDTFRALVEAGDGEIAQKKNRIKARKVFNGKSNFSPSSLDKQIANKQPVWDLGLYSENEVADLKAAAVAMRLAVEFALWEWK